MNNNIRIGMITLLIVIAAVTIFLVLKSKSSPDSVEGVVGQLPVSFPLRAAMDGTLKDEDFTFSGDKIKVILSDKTIVDALATKEQMREAFNGKDKVVLKKTAEGLWMVTTQIYSDLKVGNRHEIIVEGKNIANLAQMYYERLIVSGKSVSFNGFKIPENLVNTANGTYNIEINKPNVITIVCIGHEKGDDSVNPVKVKIKLDPDKIISKDIVN